MNNNKAVNSNPVKQKVLTPHPSSLPPAAGSAALAAAEALPLAKNKYKEFVKKFIRRKTAVVALIFILFLLIVAALGPEIAPYDANQPDYNNLLSPPSAEHIWGTDEFGRDIFSRLLAGTRLSLLSALSATIVGASIGIILGLLAGYYGGWINALVMRGSDVLFAFPDILLAIAIVAIIGPGMVNVVIAVAVFTIPSFARIVRSATLTVKEAPYVEVARSIGCKDRRILWIHVFPGTVQSMIVNFTMGRHGDFGCILPKLFRIRC